MDMGKCTSCILYIKKNQIPGNCPACPCVKTALNTHLSYIPPMLMLKIYRPRWTQCDDNTLDPLGLVMVG